MRTRVLAAFAALALVGLTGCGGAKVTGDRGGPAAGPSGSSGIPAAYAAPAAGGTSAAPVLLANTVTASGTGKGLASPDYAEMTFGVSVRREDAEDAMGRASATARKIVAALKKAGIADKDIQTAQVSLYPESRESGRIDAYNAQVSVRATVRDIADLGKVIDAATKAGAGEISGPSFMMSDDNPARLRAIDAAVADAKARAEAMAKAAGRKLGAILSLSESAASIPLYASDSRMAKADSLAPPIEPGQLETATSLTVVFALE